MQTITTFKQLEAKFEAAEQAQQVSNDAFRQALSGWALSGDLFGPAPADPMSDAYRQYQLGIYERLTNQAYSVANEETHFDFEQELKRPYPYGTQSGSTVGEHLQGFGFLIEKIDLPAGASILEIGSGYGSLTVHLAQMGYQVTCLDISQPLLEFVKTRTAKMPHPAKTICADMAQVELNELFDCVIFNASFHHSLEHRQVIERIGKAVKPGGKLVFAAEPIVHRFVKFLPYPWGLRLDGTSVWSIAKWGWMELGYRESYFIQLLNQAGWQLKRHNIGFSSYTDLWVATRMSDANSPTRLKTMWTGYDFDWDELAIRQIKRVKNAFGR